MLVVDQQRSSRQSVRDARARLAVARAKVLGVVNFPVKQIGPMRSEFLPTGFYRADGAIVLAVPEQPVENGARLG